MTMDSNTLQAIQAACIAICVVGIFWAMAWGDRGKKD
jgi:hypothetical protein